MQLSIVTETYPPEVNGVAHTARQLVDGLRRRGHVVSVVRPRQPADHADSADVLTAGVPIPCYAGLQVGLPAARIVREAWRVRRPDAVYVATEGPLGWAACRTADRLGIPVVSGIHTQFGSYLRHYGGGWLQALATRYLRAFHNRTAATVVPTAELRRQRLREGYRNLHVIGRGVDTTLFSPARRSSALRASWGAEADDVVVAYVGRLAAEKNVPLAIEAGRAMQRAHAARRLVVVGDGPMRGELEKAHRDVTFCGAQRGERLAAHYASADILLFPSETETFGNVVLEGLASGLVVVAYDYAAARAHLRDDVTGVLVPFGDAASFTARAVAVAREPSCLRAMRVDARRAARLLDWDDVVGRFESLFEEAARRARARPIDHEPARPLMPAVGV